LQQGDLQHAGYVLGGQDGDQEHDEPDGEIPQGHRHLFGDAAHDPGGVKRQLGTVEKTQGGQQVAPDTPDTDDRSK